MINPKTVARVQELKTRVTAERSILDAHEREIRQLEKQIAESAAPEASTTTPQWACGECRKTFVRYDEAVAHEQACEPEPNVGDAPSGSRATVALEQIAAALVTGKGNEADPLERIAENAAGDSPLVLALEQIADALTDEDGPLLRALRR